MIMVMMLEVSENEKQLNRLLEAVATRLETPKTELVKEIESQLSVLLGMDVQKAFKRVAAAQHHTAPSLNLDRAHKSALVLLAHVLWKITADGPAGPQQMKMPDNEQP
jgi:translation initiation factor 2 alpha subunit (eIF-2alpha)